MGLSPWADPCPRRITITDSHNPRFTETPREKPPDWALWLAANRLVSFVRRRPVDIGLVRLHYYSKKKKKFQTRWLIIFFLNIKPQNPNVRNPTIFFFFCNDPENCLIVWRAPTKKAHIYSLQPNQRTMRWIWICASALLVRSRHKLSGTQRQNQFI